jgi:POT family proton-dependent oligopeptide transporter
LFIFTVSIIFWTIYNQNSTGLTIWAERHTDRTASVTTGKLTGTLFPLQQVTDTPRLVNKVNEYFVDVKDDSGKVVQAMGPDPYFNNVPKDQWPQGKDVKLVNTELFQSINPLFIVCSR